jgi:hypothetical protein
MSVEKIENTFVLKNLFPEKQSFLGSFFLLFFQKKKKSLFVKKIFTNNKEKKKVFET